MNIKDLDISARAKSCLLNSGYTEIDEIMELTDAELSAIRNLNEKCVREIRDLIERVNLDELNDNPEIDWFDSEVYQIPIRELGMNVRTVNCLRRSNVDIIRELCTKSREDMMKVRNLGRKSLEEIIRVMKDLGVQFRPDDENAFLYGYPEHIRKIAKDKNECWEYRLYIESVIVNYEWLREFREGDSDIIYSELEILSNEDLVVFIKNKFDEIKSILEALTEAISVKAIKGFGESGVPGDEFLIIDAVDSLMIVYKDMIKWGRKVESIKVDGKYQGIIRNLASLSNDLCENLDRFYQKCIGAREVINSYIKGELSEDDLNIDLNMGFEFDTSVFMDSLGKLLIGDNDTELDEVISENNFSDDKLDNEHNDIQANMDESTIENTQIQYMNLKEIIKSQDYELPIKVYMYGDLEERYYVLQTIRDSWVYAEEFIGGKSVDYCRFNINDKLKFRMY